MSKDHRLVLSYRLVSLFHGLFLQESVLFNFNLNIQETHYFFFLTYFLFFFFLLVKIYVSLKFTLSIENFEILYIHFKRLESHSFLKDWFCYFRDSIFNYWLYNQTYF